ncbi:MAG TPA: sigma-70 family RNA polymerase sigma factor [Anaerolineae bacterium]|nr:sigma-70 family RNA polymerase sigma factor [Anaerolineae bacterium]
MNYTHLSDEALLFLIARAQPQALQELYERYNRLVFSLALGLVGDRALAEEITLDVFTKVWDRGETYRADRAKVKSWLTTIARNQAIDMLRRRRIRLDGHSLGWEQLASLPGDSHLQPEDETERSLRRERVRAAVRQLPPDQQKTLALAYFSGYSHRQIAEALDQPLGTVKTRLRLALQKLRQILHDEGLE